MDDELCMVVGTDKGVRFDWRDTSFHLTLGQADAAMHRLFELLGDEKEEPDDFVADLWVGKKIIRFGGIRFPIEIKTHYMMLQSAITMHRERIEQAQNYLDAQAAMKDIVEGLDLD